MMKIGYIELLGQKHPLCMSLRASEAISNTFGSFESMEKQVLNENSGMAAHAINQLLLILMEAGRKYCQVAGIEMPEPLPCEPADVISPTDPTVIKAITATMDRGTKREVETATKNGEATQGE